MKQTYEEASMPTNTVQEEAVAHSTVFDDVFRTIAQKLPQLLIPLINEVFHTNYSEDEDFEQLRNEHYEKYGKIITDSIIRIGRHIYHLECQSEKDAEMVIRMFAIIAPCRNTTQQSSGFLTSNMLPIRFRSFMRRNTPSMPCLKRIFSFCFHITFYDMSIF